MKYFTSFVTICAAVQMEQPVSHKAEVIKVLVTSTDNSKSEAVEMALSKLLKERSGNQMIIVEGVSDDSVTQHLTSEATLMAARMKLHGVTAKLMQEKDAEFAVTIENGFKLHRNGFQAFSWVCIKHKTSDFVSETTTASYPLPYDISKAIEYGSKHTPANDFDHNIQAEYYAPAVSFAFTPFFYKTRGWAWNVPSSSLDVKIESKL